MDSRATVAEISGAFLDAAFLFSFVLLWALEKTKKEKKTRKRGGFGLAVPEGSESKRKLLWINKCSRGSNWGAELRLGFFFPFFFFSLLLLYGWIGEAWSLWGFD